MDWPSGSIEHVDWLSELGFANPGFRGQTYLLRDRQLVGRNCGVQAARLRVIEFADEQDDCLGIVNVGGAQGLGRRAAPLAVLDRQGQDLYVTFDIAKVNR